MTGRMTGRSRCIRNQARMSACGAALLDRVSMMRGQARDRPSSCMSAQSHTDGKCGRDPSLLASAAGLWRRADTRVG